MIIIHQATFGDKAGGYALLSSSFDDESIPKRIGNSTDVHDRPVGEVLSDPIVRGFLIDDYYLVVKSFPHVEEGIRLGRVFSHSLFIHKNDIEKISNLSGLLDLLMVEMNVKATVLPIQFVERSASFESPIPIKGRAAYGVKGLLNHGEFSNTLAWIGKADFFDFLCRIWAEFPKHLRKDIFFGAAFDPRKVNDDSIKIVHVDPELAFKWKKSGFLVVEESSEAELKKESEFYLGGVKNRASSLESMIKIFKLHCDQISDLTVLEKVIATFQTLGSDASFGDLILFADLVSKYNPDPLSAANEKNQLLSKITLRMPLAKAKETLALRKVNWKGFKMPELAIGNALQDWGKLAVVGSYNTKEITKVIVSAFLESKDKEGWWHSSIRKGVLSQLKNRAGNHAKVIWEWIQLEPRLVAFLADIANQGIPRQGDLLEQLLDLEESTAREVIAISKKMNWLELHGKLLVQILPIEQALFTQLEIDTDSNHFSALKLMAKEVSEKEFVRCSISIGDKRLLEISAELVVMHSSLLENIDVQNQNWREIWLKAILKGAQPWKGVSNPQNALFELLDLLIADKGVDSQLINSLADTHLIDLSNFHGRKEIWDVLPGRSRDRYLSATAHACVVGFDRRTIQIASIEKPLSDKMGQEEFFRGIAVDKNIQLASKIALFQHFPTIPSRHLQILLENNHLDSVEATKVGNLILDKGWANVARYLLQRVSSRRDLGVALSLCYSLLSFWERMEVRIRGYADVSVSTEEWYYSFAEICSELLEKGPSQNGIWENSGGTNGDLLVGSTGKETWIHALNQIKKGKAEVKIGTLLRELQKGFPMNEKLKIIEQVRPK